MRYRSKHTKIVQWSDEDGCYVGTCPSLFFGGVHGSDEMKVYRELCQVVGEWERLERRGPGGRAKHGRYSA